VQPRVAPIRTIAAATIPSPWTGGRFVDDGRFVLEDPVGPFPDEPAAFELAGPRARIALDPTITVAGVLTAGGLCPGLNDVVRGLVLTLWHGYGVREVRGIRHGFDGLAGARAPDAIALDPASVAESHRAGGTMLGTARGAHDVARVADSVQALGLGVLACVGGDGTLKGALALDRELERRGVACAVVGIPKTIDNDVAHCSRTFGFVTAVEEAARAIGAAHAEASSHDGGVAIVQLMGRESGFIAAAASLACPDVNACLVPESPFTLAGLSNAVARRLRERGHCVIVAAEGAGAELWSEGDRARDASGNVKLPSIGSRLHRELGDSLRAAGLQATIKLIDPSYMIRSVVASPDDRVLCLQLAQAAAHAAMSGRTRVMVGLLGDHCAHVPLEEACSRRKRLALDGELWQSVLASTGQPALG
jgi:6-phosphofructokinase 1